MAEPPKTYVVKLNCYCIGCQNKLRGVFQEVHGLNSINIDGEKRKVTFTGTTDLKYIIERLAKKGMHAQIMDEPPPPAPAPPPPPPGPLNIHVTHFLGRRPAPAPAPAPNPPAHTNHCHSVKYEMGPANNSYPCAWQMEQLRQMARSQPMKSVTITFGEPAQPQGGAESSEDSQGPPPPPPPPHMPICNLFSDENANSCSIM